MKEPRVLESFKMVTVLLPKNADRRQDGERTPSPGQHPLATVKEACAPKSAAFDVLIIHNTSRRLHPYREGDAVVTFR